MTSPGGFNLATVYVQVLPSMRGFGPALAGPAGAAGGAAGGQAGSRFSSAFKSAIGGVGKVAAAALAAGGALAKFGVQGAANLETITASFTSLLGGADAAQKQIQSLTKFAAATPFETKDIFGYAQQYFALADSVGLSKDKVTDFLTTIGDLGAVTGASTANIGNAVTAIGQIGSAGKVTLDNLNQISEAFPGFNGAAAIAAATGQDTATVLQNISKGEVSATVGIPALLKGMQQFGGAAGAMEKQSQTLAGTFSTFKDTISQATTQAFLPLVPTIKATLDQLTPVIGQTLSTVAPVIASFAQNIAPALGPIVTGLGKALSSVFDAIGPALQAVAPVIAPLATAFVALATAVTPLITLVGQLIGKIGPPLLDLFSSIVTALSPVITAFADALTPVLPIVAAALRQLTVALQPVIKAISGALVQALQAIAPSLPQIATAFAQLAVAMADVLVAVAPLIGPLVKLVTTVFVGAFVNGIIRAAQAFTLVLNIVKPLLGPLVSLANFALKPLTAVFKGLGDVVNYAWEGVIKPALHGILSLFLTVVGGIVRGAASAFSWVPFVGGKLEDAADAIDRFKDQVNTAFGSISNPTITPRVNTGPALSDLGILTGALQTATSQFNVSGIPLSAVDQTLGVPGGVKISTPKQSNAIPIGHTAPTSTPTAKATRTVAKPPAFDRGTLTSFVQAFTGATVNPFDAALAAIVRSAKTAKKTFTDGFVSQLRAENTHLKGLTAQREKIAGQLQRAQTRLANARQQYGSAKVGVRDAIRGGFDLATAGKGFDGNQRVTAGNILAQLTQAVTRTKTFFSLLKTLKARGLPMALIQKLALAGVDALPQAQALAAASTRDLNKIKSQQTTLNSLGTQAGTFVADGLYKAGVQSAQGFAQGLESQQSQLNAAIRRLGNSMVKELKSVLKISSPSKVMHELGGFTGEGFERGIASKYADVRKAGGKLGSAATAVGGGSVNASGGAASGAYVTRDELFAVVTAWENRDFVLKASERELARSVRNGEKKLSRAD